MYGSIVGWRTYASARGDNAPAATSDILATAALVRATDYIRFNYVNEFLPGYDETSDYVVEATYEAASYELATPNFFTISYTPAQQKVLTEVKGIKWTVIEGKDSINAWANATPVINKIAAMLGRYMPGLSFGIGFRSIGPESRLS